MVAACAVFFPRRERLNDVFAPGSKRHLGSKEHTVKPPRRKTGGVFRPPLKSQRQYAAPSRPTQKKPEGELRSGTNLFRFNQFFADMGQTGAMVFSLPLSRADPLQRRSPLTVDRARAGMADLLVVLRHTWGNGTRLRVAYVPHQFFLRGDGWTAYAQALAPASSGPPEFLAPMMLDDIANQVVPQWISVVVSHNEGAHQCSVEDRLCDWSNPTQERLGRSAPP